MTLKDLQDEYYRSFVMKKEKFDDLNKIYIAQVINNSRKVLTDGVDKNWYRDLVGEFFVVRLREEHERTCYPSKGSLQYEVAKLTPAQKYLGTHHKPTDNYLGHGFDPEDIKIIAEYIEPVPEVPYTLTDGTKVYKKDAEGLREWLKTI